jgi:hypothetical protein
MQTKNQKPHKRVERVDVERLDLSTDPCLLHTGMLIHNITRVAEEIAQLEEDIGDNTLGENRPENYIEIEHFKIPPHSIPIRGDVRAINWKVNKNLNILFFFMIILINMTHFVRLLEIGHNLM